MRVHNPRQQPVSIDGGHQVGGLETSDVPDGPRVQRAVDDGRLQIAPAGYGRQDGEQLADEADTETSTAPAGEEPKTARPRREGAAR